MAREGPGQTLQPTALVHEAWLRLVGNQHPTFQGRAHFFAAAAEAMRRILIEKARHRKAVRHGGGQERVDLDELEIAGPSTESQLLAVNEALDRLATRHPKAAQVVKLRYYAGMTNQEAAQIIGVSPDTAKDYAAFARAWLFRELRKEQSGPS
jgi:RNA polymerase sigma factor (TIGR02999 family)